MRFFVGVLATAAALALPAAAVAKPPTPETRAATDITSTSAVLHGKLTGVNTGHSYNFAFGQTTAYGMATPTVTSGGVLGVLLPSTVYASAAINGLKPGTTYHFRLVGRDSKNAAYGADVSFTTLPASSPLSPAPTTTLPEPDPDADPGAEPDSDPGADPAVESDATTADDAGPAPEPQLGRSVVAGVDHGTVKIKVPGASGFTTLSGADEIPTGALIDTRAGTVVLETATSTGSQSVSLRGALFSVHQPAGGKGMTEFRLRGGDFSACDAPPGNARMAAAGKQAKKPRRTLWATDDNGKFRTRGRNSVATVRGTSWVTTETCAGTRTTVTEGAVAVRDLVRRKTVLVRAGGSYLARGAAR